MRRGHKVTSPATGITYEIGPKLGEGGFGTAYLAYELTRKGKRGDEVCFKTTADQASWHREAYFGEILRKQRRAIQTLDTFPILPKSGRFLYCLVSELAEHGTLADYLEARGRRPLTVKQATSEAIALLKVLDSLHGASATHRDITPMNIFVCGRGTLKLGDFGIARHDAVGAPLTVDAFNPAFVTRGMASDTGRRYWVAADDVYQMGQLLGMLLTGDPETTLTTRAVGKLEIDEHLKKVIKRAIGPRKRRYRDAFEMMLALRGDIEEEEASGGGVSSLEGKVVVFTGPMQLTRFDAEVLVRQAGGTVARDVTKKVDVVVQGGRSPHYGSGHKGRKLDKAQALRKKGHKMAIISESVFRTLVEI